LYVHVKGISAIIAKSNEILWKSFNSKNFFYVWDKTLFCYWHNNY